VKQAPLIELRDVSKRFGGVCAVESASLELRAGEVIGLLGHNGAGKSTLMKMLSGAEPCDSGEIFVEGRRRAIRRPRDAQRCGIETLYQDLALVDNLDACANLFLGRELRTRWGTLNDRAMERAAVDTLGRVNPRFAAFGVPVGRLSGGERQAVAIARALYFDARVLIMDEPTAALGPEESQVVGELIGRLKLEGLGIFLVSHDVHDVFALSDRIAVMRSGRIVAQRECADLTPDSVLELILGRDTGSTRNAD
jgi:D-xylose transport system ATP-binding protein